MKHGFLDQDAYADSAIHRLDARAKIVALLGAAVICVSTPAAAYAAFGCYAAALLIVITLARLSLLRLGRRALVVLPFVLMVAAFAPFLKTGQTGGGISLGLGSAAPATPALVVWNVAAKSLLCAALALLLTSATTFPALLQGLRRLRVPLVLVMLLSFAYRYIFVLTDELQRLVRARLSRGGRGRWLWHSGGLGQLIGTLFVRTYERAERVYAAMVSRGFEGRFSYAAGAALTWRDGTFCACFLGAFLGARLLLV